MNFPGVKENLLVLYEEGGELSKTTAAAKEDWNAAHYTQVKISVKPEIAAAFKSACAAGGASMAGVLSRCMSEYAGIAVKLAALPVDTRPNRRQAVRKIAQLIKAIRDAEEVTRTGSRRIWRNQNVTRTRKRVYPSSRRR
jgi:hypothetical protein